MMGGAVGVRIQLEIPAFFCPLFSGFCAFPVISGRSLLIRARPQGGRRWLVDSGVKSHGVSSFESLHYTLDKTLTLELQRQRPELLFLHAAVIGSGKYAVALLSVSGGGKSTTSLAALRAGMHVYSDELAPVDLNSSRVWPYRRALGLKAPPSSIYVRTRQRAIRIGRQWFLPPVPAEIRSRNQPVPLCALVLLDQNNRHSTGIEKLSSAAALTGVYSHCLNPFAHDNGGLSSVHKLVSEIPCYRISSAAPEDTVSVLRQLLESSGPHFSPR